MNLSQHFTLEELTYSATALRYGVDNTAPIVVQENLRKLCIEILEPVRTLLNCPIISDSGYRNARLNRLVGSTAEHSDHIDGNADDFKPFGVALREAFDKIRASDIPFKRIIIECNAWIHIARANDGEAPLREALLATGGPGDWKYEVVT